MAVRSETSRKAVLQATLELLDEKRSGGGLSVQKLTIEAIAKEAGVGKATIYRWWPNKAALVIDSFVDQHLAQTPVDESLPAYESLKSHVKSLVKIYSGPEGRLVAQIIAECQYDPATLAEFRERFWDGRARAITKLVERGMAEGLLRSDVDPTFVAQLIYSPIYQRLLFRTGVLDAEFASQLVDTAIQGLAPVPAVSAGQLPEGRSAS